MRSQSTGNNTDFYGLGKSCYHWGYKENNEGGKTLLLNRSSDFIMLYLGHVYPVECLPVRLIKN